MNCELIKKGSTNVVAVKAIKVRLNDLLGSKLDVQNANFGDSTAEVVKQFQRKNNLLADGIVGELTWERLFTILPKPVVKETNELRLRALEIMKSQLFVREKTNKNDGVEVEAYLKSVGLGKGYPWCMSFVYWGFLKASEALKIPNLVPKTAGVLDCLNKAKKYVVKSPAEGDQFIMDFGKNQGHTGLVTEVKDNRIFTIEGNTSADPTYAGEDREGNGVFERSRPISSIKAFIRYI